MAKKKTTEVFEKSRQRTSFVEFMLMKNVREEVQAGFKIWLKYNDKGYFHFDNEWEELFKEYSER